MAGTFKQTGSGGNAEKDDGRKTVHRKKKMKASFEMDYDVADLKVMKVKQWMEKTKDREQWRLVVEEAKAHPGL
jgi:hypothetical protein